jgi:hypothetical protein
MELLLNLAWVLLALPAYWLWRGSRSRAENRSTSLQCLFALACALVMLFPVISATDDLHAMRCEIEESPISKRSIRQASHDKASVWNSRLQSPPATLGGLPSFAYTSEHADPVVVPSFSLPLAPPVFHAGRAPPRLA